MLVELLKMLGLGAVAIALAREGLDWLLTRHLWFRRGSHKRLKEVLFFPSPPACLEHVYNPGRDRPCLCPLPHGLDTPFSRLLEHLLSACVSLDLCMFSFSNTELSRAVLLLHQRGVRVRVLTDRDYMSISGSQIGVLRKAGMDNTATLKIPFLHLCHIVRTWMFTGVAALDRAASVGIVIHGCICVRHEMIITTHMHHKFALLDGRKLITGSLNWTMTAVQSNKENVIVTEEPELVQPYEDEFNKLWEANDPAKLPPQTHNGNNTM